MLRDVGTWLVRKGTEQELRSSEALASSHLSDTGMAERERQQRRSVKRSFQEAGARRREGTEASQSPADMERRWKTSRSRRNSGAWLAFGIFWVDLTLLAP